MLSNFSGQLGSKLLKNLSFLALTILTITLVIVSNQLFLKPANAINPTGTAENKASTWQEASFPVENFQSYTSPYGERINPVTGQAQFHRGLDIAAPRGSYIRNWWAGQLVSLSDNTACGTMLVIASGAWEHVYCHLEGQVDSDREGTYFVDAAANIMIRQNQIIPGGARIARVGMTGRTTGPHLHWGLKFNGNYVDPAIVLREMYKNQ